MKLSKRVDLISESVTLKLNAKANELSASGKKVYNLTAGQLPFRPMSELIDGLKSELDFLKSYQYSPVAGLPELRTKLLSYFEESRGVSLEGKNFDCVIGNGGKSTLAAIFACLLDKGDEVIVISPYWVSYPELIALNEATMRVVETSIYDNFTPSVDEIESMITNKTKMIIINSPNNPSGTHYSNEWMKSFAGLMKKHKDLLVISDEIYYELNYFDPRPTYFYQEDEELLKRTIIVDGISKNLACTGLRIGYCFADKTLTSAMTKFLGQTASGANSLVQKTLCEFDFNENIEKFLANVKIHLRDNASIVRESFREANLSKSWYQSQSAFYYMVDFSQAPIMKKFKNSQDDQEDYSSIICEKILDECGVAMVPGIAFGMKNAARISLVLEKEQFSEALKRVLDYITQE